MAHGRQSRLDSGVDSQVRICQLACRQRDFCTDNLLVRIHFIIEMIWWTSLEPWEFEFPFSSSLMSAFLAYRQVWGGIHFRARRGNLKGFTEIHLEAKALNVEYLPYSLESGLSMNT